jgi:hypothetical protein
MLLEAHDTMIHPPFRRATRADAPALAELVNFAGEGMPLYLWEKQAQLGETAWDVGRRWAARADGSFSYRNAMLIEHHGQCAGGLIGYAIPDAPGPMSRDMPAMFVPLQELENLAKVTRNTDCPSQFASCQPLAQRRAQPITGIRQHTAKRRRNNRNASMTGTSPRASVSDTRVWQLAVLRAEAYWRSDPHRMRTLLGKRRVVDHQHGIAAADQPIRLNQQFSLHRRRIPHPGGNEVVQLIISAKRKPLRHRLNALRSPGPISPDT